MIVYKVAILLSKDDPVTTFENRLGFEYEMRDGDLYFYRLVKFSGYTRYQRL